MISIKDIAREAGVSVSTVSRAINNSGYVSPSAKLRVQEAMAKLKFRPSSIARSLVGRQSHVIGLLIPYINTPFFSMLADSIEDTARKLGYDVILCHTRENIDIERDYVNIMFERRVDGIIVVPVSKEWDHLAEFDENNSVVLCSRHIPGLNISSVRTDDIGGSFQIVEHLIKQGHKNIGVVLSHPYLSTTFDRFEGAVQAFKRYGLDPGSIVTSTGDLDFNGGYEATKEMLQFDNIPTAIYVVNQMMSMGSVKAIYEKGLRIPEDIALAAFAGFDEWEFGFLINPKITANIYPSAEIGIESMKLLHEQIQCSFGMKETSFFHRDIIIRPKLVIRNSTSGRML